MGYPPVVVVESGGVPRTQVAEGASAPAFTVVESGARPITLADNAPPIALFNEDGSHYTSLAAILGADGLDYAFFDITQTDRLFQDTAGTVPADDIGEAIGLARTVAGSPAHSASQAAGANKPALQAEGAKFNGTSGFLLSDWLAQTGENCIILQATIAASIAATQIICGATDAAGANSFQLGVNTAGNTVGGFGSQSFTTVMGSGDIRGQEAIIALSVSASTVKLFAQGAEVYSAARVGNPTTTRPVAIGGRNVDGTVANFFDHSIKRIAFGKVAPTLAQYQQIRRQWLIS